ncbi:MAG: hypothetical protein O7G86_18070 [Gammaproteobacteria bacterium]|nr:hypothetical protein [Gammaproteobacteria bacterium]MCZ6855824.1 hypothetical protein [Gammaproteobacteria bacterium]
MRLIHVVLVVLLLIAGLIGWIAVSVEPPMSTGGPHPDIEGMSIGGDGLARLGPIFSMGFALQALFVVLVHLLVALSVAERNRTAVFWTSLAGAGLVSLWVCWKIFSSYAGFLETGETGYFLGFPIASAWMMFGIWLSGALLAVIYVVGFRRFVFTLEDEAAYDLLEAEARTQRASPPASPNSAGRST